MQILPMPWELTMILADCSQSWRNLVGSLDVCSPRHSCCGWTFSSSTFSPFLGQTNSGDRATINNENNKKGLGFRVGKIHHIFNIASRTWVQGGMQGKCKYELSILCISHADTQEDTTNIKKITHPAQSWSNCHMNTSPWNAPNPFPDETSICEPGAGARRSSIPGSANIMDGECSKANEFFHRAKSPRRGSVM